MIEEEKSKKRGLEKYFFKSLYCFGGSLFLILLAFAFPVIFVVFWFVALIVLFTGFIYSLRGLGAWANPEAKLSEVRGSKARFKFGIVVLFLMTGIAFFGLTWLSSIFFNGHWDFG